MRAAAIAAATILSSAACAPKGAEMPAPVAAGDVPPPGPARTFGAGPASAVVLLAPGVPTAILVGPFQVTAINPGSELDLSIVSGSACAGRALWFAYSGGGVAVADGEVLCARSHAGAIQVDAFSGIGAAPSK